MQLQVIDFIHKLANNDWEPERWEDVLSAPPYCLQIRRETIRGKTYRDDVEYVLLAYNQVESDFSEPIVRECRGLILKATLEQYTAYHEHTGARVKTIYTPVAIPFFKFFNAGEPYAAQIDWSSAKVQEKLDGSVIKCWFDDTWHVSTNGCIDAYKAPVNDTGLTFGELFDVALRNSYFGLPSNSFYSKLDKRFTYMFELCTPQNRVIVYHNSPKLYHIGTRNNETLEELDVGIGLPTPNKFLLHSLEDCIEAAKVLPVSQEGYVVVDKHWNRVKIKSPKYVALSHLKGVPTTERLIDLLRAGETEEFLAYFPDYAKMVKDVEQRIESLIDALSSRVCELGQRTFATQKDYAMEVKESRFSAFFFENRKNGTTAREWLDRMESWRVAKYLEEK